jgi:hypothetical protein
MKCNVSGFYHRYYHNQSSIPEKWQFDDDKLTFIILARDETQLPASKIIPDDSCLKILPMIGDANIFLHGPLTSDDLDAEVEIMIAGKFFILF